MATLRDSLVSSSARKLAMRMRPDLSARQHRYQGRLYWVVKEPVGLNYFRFQEEEYAILQMLDGEHSLDDIKDEFEANFPPQKITVEELQQFIGMLHRSGLILVNVPGQGKQLKQRRDERKKKELVNTLTNILSIRFKGIDPDKLLNWMHPFLSWIYTPLAVFVWMVVALGAGLLVSVQFDIFQSKLPTFHQFFSAENAFMLAVALGVTKVIHEFGHGLTCKHFGGECHEMGVMILVLTPCLYCNVSDSWMLPNKWHRAAIGAAGIYVEIFIASICTYVWWFTEPGLLNHLCLSTMFVCSVSTILFNGNPLLRYDGYYILSDIAEIPNLRQKASDILARKMGQWCLGLERPDDPFLPQRNQMMFAIYSVAAAIYKWIVTFSIMWFLYEVWKPYRLEILGQIIGLAALYGLLVQPLWKLCKFFYIPGRIEKVKKPRMYASLAVLAAVILAVLFIPLPYRVFCTLHVEARDAASVYVTVPGQLRELHVKPGQYVEANELLAKLDNIDVDLAIARLTSERDQYISTLENLQFERFTNPESQSRIPATKKMLDAVENSLAEKSEDRRRLELRSPTSGTLLPPPAVPHRPDPDGNLSGWSGTPFDANNEHCVLPESALFGQIGDPSKLEAVLIIDQSEIDFVAVGQTVKIKLDQLPHATFHAEIVGIASDPLKVSPKQLTNKAGGDLATKTDESGVERPMSVSYQARVPIDDPDGLLRIGLRGKAKISAGYQTVWQRVWRYATQTFNFRM